MPNVDIVIQICGMAGDGIISGGEILTRCMSDQGFDIISFDSYPAEIRGFGKCVAHARISSREILTPGKYAHVLVSLNDDHSIGQLPSLAETGVVIYDNQPPGATDEGHSLAGRLGPGMIPYGVPLHELAHKAAGNARGRNMVALGALAALFHIDLEAFRKTILKRYGRKPQAVIDNNLNSFLEGYNWTRDNVVKIDKMSFARERPKKTAKNTAEKIILSGNQAVVRAALDSGLHLYAGYPITPATSIMEYLARELPARGGVVLQTEDEISAIGTVIGSGFGGKRAMTATSGPGLCLMTELINYAVMAEAPAVIINSQRGGPSTGLPTKTEQADLDIAVHGGAGDSPRIVLAPTTVAECYDIVCLAFHLAEKYQTAVIVLLDFFLSRSLKNVNPPKPPPKKWLNSNIAPSKAELKDYKRYLITNSGVSPRALPGTPGGMHVNTGLEHTERAQPAYDAATHTAMTKKRFQKLTSALAEIPEPVWYGDKKDVSAGVLSWGSSTGAAREAVDAARALGIRAATLKTVSLNPLHTDHINRFMDACDHVLVAEANWTGQFANLIEGRAGNRCARLTAVPCAPLPAEDILERIKELGVRS